MRMLSVLSDLHLGDGSVADDACYEYRTRLRTDDDLYSDLVSEISHSGHLVLNGDIYELWQFNVHDIRDAWPKSSALLSSPYCSWVQGNHDEGLGHPKSCVHKLGPMTVRIEHGHDNDPSMTSRWSRFWHWVFRIIEPVVPQVDAWLTQGSDVQLYKKVDELVRSRFELYTGRPVGQLKELTGLNEVDADSDLMVLILGHTHRAGVWAVYDESGHLLGLYANSGACTHGRLERVRVSSNGLEVVQGQLVSTRVKVYA